MKRKLLNCFIAAALMLGMSITASAETVTITTQAEFDAFVTRVNGGETELDAELTTDVTATTGQYIGTIAQKYKGTFNGRGNTITVNYSETTADHVALIRYAESATICNLTVNGTISVASGSNDEGKFSAAFIGETFENITVKNCVSNVIFSFDASSKADATYGAIIGVSRGTVMIENCAALGSVSSANANSIEGIGGFVGWNGAGGSAATIINSYSKQTYSGLKNDNPGNNFSRNGASISNSYYLNAVNTDDSQGTQKTDAEFADGTVAGLLGYGWKQSGSDIVFNDKAIDVINCASGAVNETGNDYEITLIVPSKYIDGTDIDAAYDLYVSVYDNDSVEVVAPAVQIKGDTVVYTQTVSHQIGKYTIKLSLKDTDDTIISEEEVYLIYDNSFRLNNEVQTYSMAEGEVITVYDNGGINNNYSCNEMEDGSFTVSAPANSVLFITGNHWLVLYHDIDLTFTKNGVSRTQTLVGNWNGNNINEIHSNPGEELTIEFTSSGYSGDSRGGFELNIEAKAVELCTVTLNANGGTDDDLPLSLAKNKTNILPANIFTRESYVLKGWSTTAGGELEYNNGAEITPAGDMTLYAVWEEAIVMHSGNITLTEDIKFYDSGSKYNNYSDNEDDTLTVNAPAGKLVQVNFARFTVYSDLDYLEIYNGTSTDTTLIAKLDADFSASKTYTATNANGALTFRFFSNGGKTTASGWEAMLTTIDKPTEYTLSFINGKGDALDDITVFDGLPINALPVLEDIGGSLFLGWYIDSVRITSETAYNYGANKTAIAMWEQVYLIQNGNVTLDAGESYGFYDSGYKDNNYSDYEDYTLIVNAPAGKVVQVSFSSYDIEGDNFDYLEIYDGSSIDSDKLLATLEGTGMTITYIATLANGGALTFYFKSDDFGTYAGWEATLTTIDPPTEYTLSFINDKGDAPDDIAVFGGLTIGELPELEDVGDSLFLGWDIDSVRITSETLYNYGENKTATAVWGLGYLMQNGNVTLEAGESYRFYDSGSMDNNYLDDENYTLTVNAPAGKVVQVSFSSYDIEINCDYLDIYDGISTDSDKLLATLESENMTNVDLTYIATAANGGALTFNFRSDGSVIFSGWEAMLTTNNIDYTITYNLDEGINDVNNPETYTVDDNITLAAASREGFTFKGWYTEAEFTNEVTEIALGSTGDVVLFAKFLEAYTITYNLDEGTNDANNPETYTVESETITLADASKDGYTFEGWYSEAEFTNEVTEIALGSTVDIVLFAKFLEAYTITYNLDEGTNDANNPETYTVESETITLADASKDGYTFEGWYSEAEFANEVTEIALGSTEDVVLFAKWEIINYTITYNLDGGINDANNPETYTVESETITLADASREGFTFAGWYTEAEFINEVTEIALGSIGDVVLFAKWTENETVGFDNATVETFTQIENTIYFSAPTEMAVYSVSGIMLYSGTVTEYTLPEAAAVYIICTSNGSYKVMRNN